MRKCSAGPETLPKCPHPWPERAQDPRREKAQPSLCSLEDQHWPRQREQVKVSLSWSQPHLTLQG